VQLSDAKKGKKLSQKKGDNTAENYFFDGLKWEETHPKNFTITDRGHIDAAVVQMPVVQKKMSQKSSKSLN